MQKIQKNQKTQAQQTENFTKNQKNSNRCLLVNRLIKKIMIRKNPKESPKERNLKKRINSNDVIKFLDQCLSKFSDHLVMVMDNASCDKSTMVVREYADKNKDKLTSRFFTS